MQGFVGCGVVLIKINHSLSSMYEILLAIEQVERHLFVAVQSRQGCV